MTELSTMKDGVANQAEASDRVLQILAEAGRLFASKGFEGTSMRDIALACGISKSLLYHHFANKDEIYARVAVGSTLELYLFVRDRIPDGAPSQKIRAFMVATAEYFRRYRWAWIASTTAFWNDPDRHRHKERLTRRDRFENFLRGLIQEAIDAGEIRKVDVPMTGRLILSSLNWMHRWYNPNKSATPEQIAEIFFDMIFNGLRSGELVELPGAVPPKEPLKTGRRKSR
ncbi:MULTISPECIES: TetR/AcrR family transcriptional regulator [unclassified Bradyrhizobium]|uniref:TetR/AcrR family transcriptional regulator n=1 Tax=unclassified Bradyrhizobium TaxID=2631580 RepID=UPI0004772682|nr:MULTISPECIES: TetR/AcrR family transcriptional regulator [unclassified Bradyrhizobium]MBB4256367.1 AcrR family transcriptional regulator [Bradyrhizobium sp. CIR3A]MBB4362586.1 AcrR family transcriptional regulator [Bradyrhizobium sp. CIR18]MBB4378944.1 AcrR family transcriptional regulator [Bradyrhizobium sp. SBR1B]MBB4397407.1 AcrR family transcriptional regulator [Bradyrhizobium sp. ERR14]MBB4425657.1 AcrR family transcriptional regulator [Bradyrhizobium sp. CIR48]